MKRNLNILLPLLSLLLVASCASPTDYDVERIKTSEESESGQSAQYKHSVSFVVDGSGYNNLRVELEEISLWSLDVRDSIAELSITGSALSIGIDTVSLLLNFHIREGWASFSNFGAYLDYTPESFVSGPIVLARLDELGSQPSAPWYSFILVHAFDQVAEKYELEFNGDMINNSRNPNDQKIRISGQIVSERK